MKSKNLEKRTTFSVGFVCRPSKCDRKGLAPIEMTISLMGSRMVLSLPNKVSPDEFRKCMGMKKNSPVRLYCQKMEEMVSACMPDMVGLSVSDSLILLKRKVRGEDFETTNVGYQVDKYLSLLSKRVGVSLTMGNYSKYRNILGILLETVGRESSVTDITCSIIESIKCRLDSEYKKSTVSNFLTKLKSFIIYLQDEGILKSNPFRGIKISKKGEKIDIISEEEYGRIRDIRFDIPRLEKVRKIFVLMCNCGLAYCDIQGLVPEDIQYVDGRMVINKLRGKTGVEFTSVVLDDGRNIIDSLCGDFSLLKMSNQKMNSYLGEIADMCRITKSLTCHKGRHYYITHLMRMGIPTQVVQKCAGHANISMTMRYTHLLKDDVVRAFASV